MTDVHSPSTAQTQVPMQNMSQPAKGRNNIVLIIVIVLVILVFCCCSIGGILIFNGNIGNRTTTNNSSTVTPTSTIKDDRYYANGKDKPPLSKSFTDSLNSKTRKLSLEDGYKVNVNALGDPSYTFSFLFQNDWKTTKFTKEDYILASEDGDISIGVLYFEKDTRAYQLSCFELISELFSDSKWDGKDAGNVDIYDDTWNRVTYTVDKGTVNEARGVDQCLKREDALLLYFFVASSDQWAKNADDFGALTNDIYVSKTSLEY